MSVYKNIAPTDLGGVTRFGEFEGKVETLNPRVSSQRVWEHISYSVKVIHLVQKTVLVVSPALLPPDVISRVGSTTNFQVHQLC